MHTENSRLEMFCDAVIAIAITLLILEIKVPPVHTMHSISDVWCALGHLWPSFFAFGFSFMIILIVWFNHHECMKLIRKSSPPLLFATGFFLLTIVFLPFPTAFLAEYLGTEYVQPAVFLFLLSTLLNNIAWNLMFYTALKPEPLTDDPVQVLMIKKAMRQCQYGFVIYSVICILSWWWPYIALGVNFVIWLFWIYVGVSIKNVRKEVAQAGQQALHKAK